MLRADPAIRFRSALGARALQAVFPLAFRLGFSSPELQFATKPIAKPTTIDIPTRHGQIRALVYRPMDDDVAKATNGGTRPPLHLITHGGAFILRMPEQEDNVARFIASEVGAFVVVPDYDTAPTVCHPVSAHQAYDTFVWARDNAGKYGWDPDRLTVGGPSAGGHLAVGVAIQALEAGSLVPLAISSEYGVADLSMPDELRTSPRRVPIVSHPLLRLVRNTYFLGADLRDPLASPALYPRLAEFPPTLVLTAGWDTLRHEMNSFARALESAGVDVTHRQFSGVDHGFTHTRPVQVAREAIFMIGEHLRKAYSASSSPPVGKM